MNTVSTSKTTIGRVSRPGLAAAAGFATALLLWAPFVDLLRAAIRGAFPGEFRSIVGGGIAGVVGAAIVVACLRIRDRRLLRFGALGVSLLVGLAYARATSTGNPDIDVVERFHFVEFGLLALLFYRAWRPLGDGALFLLPLAAGMIVGTLDEWLQWFIPVRVGEVHDVFLNGIALVCGVLFGAAFDPPAVLTLAVKRRNRSLVASCAALTILVLGLFFDCVHLGYEIRDSEGGRFRSRYTAAELMSSASERRQRWQGAPLVLHRLSREDQYFSEGVWHAQRRNVRLTAGDVVAAWSENRILEIFYEPVLDSSSYVSPTGFRWPAEQRADVQSRVGPGLHEYVSEANPFPIHTWPKWLFRAGLAVCIGLIGVVALRSRADSAAKPAHTGERAAAAAAASTELT